MSQNIHLSDELKRKAKDRDIKQLYSYTVIHVCVLKESIAYYIEPPMIYRVYRVNRVKSNI